MPTPEPVLRVAGVSFGYGERDVLRDIDLTLERGAACALIGPNGAGKSSLTRLVCGSLVPRSGAIRVAGADPSSHVGARSAIAAVPQRNALFPKLTVRENVRALAAICGRPSAAADCDRALALSSSSGFADLPVGTLSGGQARLANIAVAMTGHPRLLVLDEPTVGVDATGRDVLAATIARLRREGMAVLLVTHDLPFAEATASEAVVLVDGRIAASGPLRDLFAEAFGAGAVEVTALLGEDPGPDDRRALARAGLNPTEGPRCWSAMCRDAARAAELQDALRGTVSSLAELRTRAAGLPALLRAATVAQRDLAA